MGKGPAKFTKRDVKTAVSAVSEAGCNVIRVEIDKSGKIVVVTAQQSVAEENRSEWDEVLRGADAA
jgi:hypothetical protein